LLVRCIATFPPSRLFTRPVRLKRWQATLSHLVCGRDYDETNITDTCLRTFRIVEKVFFTETLGRLGRDSSVGIATRYGPVGGEIFRTRPDRSWGLPSLLYIVHRIFFPGVKWSEFGADYPSRYRVEVKERVVLYLCTPVPPVACHNVNFNLLSLPKACHNKKSSLKAL
jgi:hypothetical protein